MIRKLLRRALSNGGVDYDPYDRTVRESLAEREFAPYRGEPAPGTIARSRLILDIIQETFPTEELTNATADIVTKRAVRGLEQSKMHLDMAEHRHEKSVTLVHAINKRHVDDGLTAGKQALAALMAAQTQAKVLREAGLVTSRAAVAAVDEKVADLKGDLDSIGELALWKSHQPS